MTGRRVRGRRHHSGAGEEGGGGEAGSGPHRQNGDEGHERGAQRISCRDARRRPRCSGGESAEPARPMTMMRANPRHGLLGRHREDDSQRQRGSPCEDHGRRTDGDEQGVHHELGPRKTDAPGERGAPAGRRPDRRSSPARGPPRRPDPSAPRHRCAPSRSCRVTAESTPSAAGSEARASGDASSKRSSTSGGSPSSYQPFRPWAMVPSPSAGQAPQEDAGATAATARNSTRRPAIPHAEPSGNLAEAHRGRGDLVPDPSRSLTTSTCPDARRRPTEACRTTSASCVAMMSAVPKERCGSRMRSMTCSADPSSRAPAGSSARRRRGRFTGARHGHPLLLAPGSWSGSFSTYPPIPTASSIAIDRPRRSRRPTPRAVGEIPTLSTTFSTGEDRSTGRRSRCSPPGIPLSGARGVLRGPARRP